MYTILICAVLGILIGLLIKYSNRDEYSMDYGFHGFIGGFFGLIGGLLCSLLFLFIIPNSPIVEIKERNLVSLSFDSRIDGNFFLGSGTIKEQPAYYFYLQNEDSTFYLSNAYCWQSVIRYSQGQPKVEIQTTIPDWRWVFPKVKEILYIFHVPYGSIKNDFKLNP